MSKGLFWALFLFACATAALGMKPTVSVPAPDEEQQIDQMFDSTNRLRAERRIPILGLDARLCHAATVHAEEMARYNYVSDRAHAIRVRGADKTNGFCGARSWRNLFELESHRSPASTQKTSWNRQIHRRGPHHNLSRVFGKHSRDRSIA